MTLRSARVLLAKRPVGLPTADVYAFDEVDVPSIRDGEALVQNLYIALDPAIRGWMNESKGSYMPPIELGAPVRSGNVSKVLESKIPGVEVGQVYQTLAAWEDYSVLDARAFHGLVEREAGVSVRSAVHLFGGSGLTAYFGLFDVGQPKAGDTVVVSAASGSVGSLVGQMAKHAGCRVVGITGGAEKARWLVDELGFDAAIDHRTEELRAALKTTCPKGIDVYFDSVGGEMLDTVLARINVGARVVLCGAIASINATTSTPGPRNYVHLIAKRARMQGFVTIDYMKRYPEARSAIAAWVREEKLRFHEDVVKGLANAPTAYLRLFDGTHRGKLLIELSDPEGM